MFYRNWILNIAAFDKIILFFLLTAKDRQEQKNADTKNEDFITDDAASSCSAHSNDSSGKGRERRGSHRGYLPTDSYAPATSPMKELEGELEDEADKGKLIPHTFSSFNKQETASW